jgi:hypothetical protein
MPEDTRPDEEKLQKVVAVVAARLLPVCSSMDPASFDELVLKVARFKVRWGATSGEGTPPQFDSWLNSKLDERSRR